MTTKGIISAKRRGAFIVFEGGDRCGKSTHCRRLLERLLEANVPAKLCSFPDRTTQTGSLINNYLRGDANLDDRAMGICRKMKDDLNAGTCLIVDRYAFSGVAFSAAKGLPLAWCKNPDVGLPRPDIVIFMDVPPEEAAKRAGFGEERYEKLDFQKRVCTNFKNLKESNWKVVDASEDPNTVHEKIYRVVSQLLENLEGINIGELWTED